MNIRRKDGGMHTSMVRAEMNDGCHGSVLIIVDKWIARQMEIHPDKEAVLLVAGRSEISNEFETSNAFSSSFRSR